MNLHITVQKTEDMRPLVEQAIKSGLTDATSKAVDIQKENVPVKTRNLSRSIQGDFTKLDNFTAAVVQNDSIAPYGKWTNEGTGVFGPHGSPIVPTHGKALGWGRKLGTTASGKTKWEFVRRSVKGQKARHWWEKVKDQTGEIKDAFAKGFTRIIGKGG